jgi:hypothetical protein
LSRVCQVVGWDSSVGWDERRGRVATEIMLLLSM